MRGILWGAGLSRAALLFLWGAGGGCAGRADYRQGLEHELRGELREAYRDYHVAFRKSGRGGHRSARDAVGSLVAEGLRGEGRALEAAGHLEPAVERYLHALEYDPERAVLAGDLLRARERIEAILERARRAEVLAGTLDAYALWRGLREEAVAFPEVYRRIGDAACAWADREVARLAGAGEPAWTPGAAEGVGEGEAGDLLPAGREALEVRLACLRVLLERIEGMVEEDGEDAEAAALEALLAPACGRVREAIDATGRALAAEEERSRATRLEAEGRHGEALLAHARALHLRPSSCEVRDALASCLSTVARRASRAAGEAMERGDFRAALAYLQEVERLRPGDETVERRKERCRRELQAALLQRGARFRERGLPGNALQTFLAARALGAQVPGLEREILDLEEAIRTRWRGEVDLVVPPLAAGEERFDARLFGEDVRGRVEAALRRSFPGSPGSGRGGGSGLRVELEDVDFEYRLDRKPAGFIETRWVAEFTESENPEHLRAREELAGARKTLDEARRELEVAPPGRRPEAEVLLAMAESTEKRTAAVLNLTRATLPVPVWRTEARPVTLLRLDCRCALRVRVDGEPRWIEVRSRFEDRAVEGDARRGIPPDPDELPTRAEALNGLVPLLAEKLAQAASERAAVLRLRLLEAAKERFSAQDTEGAVEDLMAFLHAERAAGPGPRYAEAQDLLGKHGETRDSALFSPMGK